MDALILAAGFGSRLRLAEPCKPLTRIHGLSLLEIAVRQLTQAGATRVVIATGYNAELVESEALALARRLGVAVETCRVPDYTKPNGYSILAAADRLGDGFMLVMADHILSSDALYQLVASPMPDQGVILAIDRDIESERVDAEDATWVKTDELGRIVQIGKHIEQFDAVDCGAFIAGSALIEAIQSAIAQGKPGSLSDGMQVLADQARAVTCDIGAAWWIDVDEPHSLALARAQVQQHLPQLFRVVESQMHETTTRLNVS